MKKLFGLALIPVLALSLSACGNNNNHESHSEHSGSTPASASHQHTNQDIQETTKSIAVLPSFLNNQDQLVRQVYQLAGQNWELLQTMPCYCGCGESAGHKSNQNCFIKEVKENAVIWDDHGTRCGVCLEIAVLSVKMKEEGKTVKEIREYIDSNYKTGYAKPTNTPMPS